MISPQDTPEKKAATVFVIQTVPKGRLYSVTDDAETAIKLLKELEDKNCKGEIVERVLQPIRATPSVADSAPPKKCSKCGRTSEIVDMKECPFCHSAPPRDEKKHECCDGECNHDDCCGKIPENCPLLATRSTASTPTATGDTKKTTHQQCDKCGYRFHTVPPAPVSAICGECGGNLKPIFDDTCDAHQKEDCMKCFYTTAPTDPTPIGEWEVEFDAKFTDFPAMMSKVEAKYFIKNTLLSQKEQHEKQLQAVREESEKHGETKWGDAKANWQEECREEGRTQERSQIVKLIEAKLDKLTKYGNDRQYGNEWCWTEREVRTILNALKSSKELK